MFVKKYVLNFVTWVVNDEIKVIIFIFIVIIINYIRFLIMIYFWFLNITHELKICLTFNIYIYM
jgi:hypothetical protein